MTAALIALWIATLGADRIDLAGGAAPFGVLPFYPLTALLVATEWLRRQRAGALPRPSATQWRFAALVLALLTLTALSVFRSGDVPLSVNRLILLGGVALGSGLALWLMSDRDDLALLLARGAQLGLALALLADALQLAQFLGALPDDASLGPVRVLLTSHSYGILPRLTGLSWDINGAGGTMLVQAALIWLAGPSLPFRRAWLALAGLLIALTLSRSAALAALPAVLLLPRVDLLGRGARLAVAGGCIALALAAAALLSEPTRAATAQALAPLAERFDPTEASAQSHAHLMARGLDEATRDVPRTLLGAGYGSSHRLLQDIFPGLKHGNFHTLYLQLWVESGVFALLAFVAILVATWQRAGALRGLVVGFALYNIFYQGLAQPAFWILIALVWATTLRRAQMGKLAMAALALFAIGCSGLVTDTPITGDIAVQVSGRQGQPIEGVELLVYSGARHYGYARTDASGRALFRELPRADYGIFAALKDPIRGLNWITPGADPGNGRVPIRIEGGDREDVSLTLLRFGPGTAEVLVEDDEGARIPGVPVTFFSANGIIGSVVTNDTGAVRATDIPFGAFGISVPVPSAIGGTGAPDVWIAGLFMDGGHVERRTMVLPRCRGTIAVTVRDDANATVPNYPVRAFTATQLLDPVATDASGAAMIAGLRCGEYGVALRAEPGFAIDDVEGQAYVSGIVLTRDATQSVLLRVRRAP